MQQGPKTRAQLAVENAQDEMKKRHEAHAALLAKKAEEANKSKPKTFTEEYVENPFSALFQALMGLFSTFKGGMNAPVGSSFYQEMPKVFLGVIAGFLGMFMPKAYKEKIGDFIAPIFGGKTGGMQNAFEGMSNLFNQKASVEIDGQEYEVINIDQDGNCAFNSVFQAAQRARVEMPDGMNTHADLRAAVVEHLRGLGPEDRAAAVVAIQADVQERLQNIQDQEAREELQAQFLGAVDTANGDIYEAYLNLMERNGTWGGDPEIGAMAQILNVRIEVYNAADNSFHSAHGDEASEHTLRLQFSLNHFDALLPKQAERAQASNEQASSSNSGLSFDSVLGRAEQAESVLNSFGVSSPIGPIVKGARPVLNAAKHMFGGSKAQPAPAKKEKPKKGGYCSQM